MVEINDFTVEKEAIDAFFAHFDSLKKLNITVEKGEFNSIKKTNNDVKITAMEKVYIFRMLSFAINEEGDLDIKEVPQSNKLTFYTDCSRNAVLSVEYGKETILNLAANGYNVLSLYTEDTIEVGNEPYFGYMRGRYTKEEIKELVRYGKLFGIELVPGIATLAHLNNIFFWPHYETILDNFDVIMMGDPRTYELFDNLFKTLSECYESRTVHIGFDEASRACLGRYYEFNGPVDRTKVVLEHLHKIIEIATKYGFKCSMWADMFFRLQYGKYYLKGKEPKFDESIKKLVPSNVELIYWDYYHPTQDWYNSMIKRHFELSDDLAFAGGAWNWLGYAPMNKRAFIHSKKGLAASRKYNLSKIYLSAWGDNGSECSRGAIAPVITLYAESYNCGNISDKWISKRVEKITGNTLSDFFALDTLNEYGNNKGCQKGLTNPAKFIVYNDPMCGIFDYHIKSEHVDYFKKCLTKVKKIAKKETPYQYVFKTNVALAKLLVEKAMIGNNLQKAYKENDKAYLENAAKKIVPSIIKRLNEFEELVRQQWFKENKTFGFDVLQLRIGGQRARLNETIKRLNEYLSEKIFKIEELEVEKLSQAYAWEDEFVYKHNYSRMAVPVNIE